MTQLKRTITLPLLTFYGLGTILGAGVYVLIGKVASFSGVYTPFAFLLSALIAGLTGLSYAELSSRFPKSGGEATYTLNAFHSHRLAAVVGWLIVMTGIVSAATIARGVVGYLDYFIQLPASVTITLVTLSLSALAIWGIKESVTVACIIALLEILGLSLVIITAHPDLKAISQHWHTLLPPTSGQYWPGVFAGTFIAFYAFIGFEDMVNIAEEVITPEKNLPRGIIIAIVISTLLYLLVAFVAITSLSLEDLTNSPAPMSMLFATHGGSATLMAAISLVAVINGALVQIIMASRVIYGMGSQGSIPKWFATLNDYTQTPIIATLLVSGAILFFALLLPLTRLAQTTSFLILSIFTLMNISLLKVKREQKSRDHDINIPWILPALGALTCLLLIAAQI